MSVLHKDKFLFLCHIVKKQILRKKIPKVKNSIDEGEFCGIIKLDILINVLPTKITIIFLEKQRLKLWYRKS